MTGLRRSEGLGDIRYYTTINFSSNQKRRSKWQGLIGSTLVYGSVVPSNRYKSDRWRVLFVYIILHSWRERTMLPLVAHWQTVWSKKQDCRIKLIWYLNTIDNNTIDKVPIFPYCAYQVKEHAVCIPLGLLKKVVNEVLCKRTPYFRRFLPNATSNQRTVCGYMSFIWLCPTSFKLCK